MKVDRLREDVQSETAAIAHQHPNQDKSRSLQINVFAFICKEAKKIFNGSLMSDDIIGIGPHIYS